MVQEILHGLPEPWKPVRPKTVDSDAVIQAIEANPVSST